MRFLSAALSFFSPAHALGTWLGLRAPPPSPFVACQTLREPLEIANLEDSRTRKALILRRSVVSEEEPKTAPSSTSTSTTTSAMRFRAPCLSDDIALMDFGMAGPDSKIRDIGITERAPKLDT